jgi:hypothetical protein
MIKIKKHNNVKTEKRYNVKTLEEKNVFESLKQTFKRGNGLSQPSRKGIYNVNINQQENNEAVKIQNKREIRISTYISKEIGDLLDEIIIKIKKTEKRKPKINEILERAIKKLYEDMNVTK